MTEAHRSRLAEPILLYLLLTTMVLTAFVLTAAPASALREVRVGTYGDAPLVSLDAQGRPVGLYVDIVKQIAARNDWHVTFVDGSWNDNLTWLQTGKIDLVLDMAQTPERLADYSLNDNPVVPKWSQIYVSAGSAIKTIRDLNGQRVAVNRGDVTFAATQQLAKQWLVKPAFVVAGSTSEQFDLLGRGEVAAVATDNIAGIAVQQSHGVVASSILFAPFTTGFGTAKGKNLDLLTTVDSYISSEAGSPISAYSQTLKKWLQPTAAVQHIAHVPAGIVWGLVGAAALVALLLGASAVLRHQVRLRTRELAGQNAALSESERRFAAFATHMPGRLWIRDRDLRYLYVNPQVETDLGGNGSGYLGKSPEDLLDEESAAKARAVCQRALNGEVVDTLESWPDKTGASVFRSLVFAVDHEDEASMLGGLMFDVTDQHAAQQELSRHAERLRRTLEGAVQAMGQLGEARDPYTAGHERRVSELSVAIAQHLGHDEEAVRRVFIAGMLHDIGKIVVPSEILSKPGRLSETEFALIKAHPEAAHDILRSLDFDFPLADIVAQHHERLDGSGYPAGLTGEAILAEARILAVADVIEAMISHRPYRPALPLDEAMAEIEAGAGSR
jgi:putative nucleotidyltransferase with HDIG domain/PAS domain S-box-containing protein